MPTCSDTGPRLLQTHQKEHPCLVAFFKQGELGELGTYLIRNCHGTSFFSKSEEILETICFNVDGIFCRQSFVYKHTLSTRKPEIKGPISAHFVVGDNKLYAASTSMNCRQ